MRAAVYSLAIVLALAMVLCMIPASFADTTTNKTIADKSYDIKVYSWKDGVGTDKELGSKDNTNSVTAEYNYEQEDEDLTGKFTEDRKMALVRVEGFDVDLSKNAEVYIDGKKLQVNDLANYDNQIGFFTQNGKGIVIFPIELTKSGYTETFLIEVTDEVNNVNLKETAKVSVKLENTAEYKNAKTATISKIESTKRKVMDAYIVGSKIYFDYVGEASDDSDIVEITFKDNTGDLFDVVTWAEETTCDESGSQAIICLDEEKKLDNSKVKYTVNGKSAQGNDDYYNNVVFTLETASAIFETKEYDVVVREHIKEADPQGIYFAESSKTIKIGEEYTPVVMGVATNKKVDATIEIGTRTEGGNDYAVNAQYVDVTDGETVIGTQEGVAYITAEYETNDGKVYKASSMKITVTAGDVEDDDDDTDGKTYMVTASSLRVRSGAGTNFSQIGSLKNGATVKVESIANGWAKLENGGYVSAQYLAEVVDNGEAQTMYVTARTLNVRKGPGTSYAKVGTLSRGTAVQVVGFSGNWAKLSNGYYVSTSYLAK